MSGNGWAIDLHRVHKTYSKKIRALQGVDIRLAPGEIFGLLGPNGAGKSTLVKIMMTVVLPDAAEGTILGQPLGHNPTLRRVGYLPEGHRFPPYLSGRQVLDYYARLSKVQAPERRRSCNDWLERMGLSRWGDTRVSQYSKGMLQRIGVAQSILHEPDLVVLDEPTDGVDPIGRKQIREILLELKSQGKAIFINSHILSELELVCDRVAILVDGQVARQGTVDELTADSAIYSITARQSLGELREEIGKLGGELKDKSVTIRGDDAAVVNRIIDVLRARDITIETVQRRRWTLEDVFIDAACALKEKS